MPLCFEDGEIIDLARQLAEISGESLSVAIRNALEERLGRARISRHPPVDAALNHDRLGPAASVDL